MDHVLLTLAFGVLVGLALGLVGGGGSILTVPILIYALGESVHLSMPWARASTWPLEPRWPLSAPTP